LQPQPLEILQALLERPGEVVTREELRRRLWSDGAYVDFDRSLNKAIVKLRDALGDNADSPRYIETLPRHGYRFIPLPQLQAHVESAPREVSAPNVQPTTAPMANGREQAFQNGTPSPATKTPPIRRPPFPTPTLIAALVAVALLAGVYAFWRSRSGASVTSGRVEAPSQPGLHANRPLTSAVAFAPPLHSIAVLPFVNMSGDPSQEYFSDGLSEELLNHLSSVNELQVAARTSSFSFKGTETDIGVIAHKLNVGAVLEGSVRRSGHTVRISTQLVNAVTGFHMWSETYDRNVGDMLALQTEIANAVASALKVRFLGDPGDVGARIEVGGTRNGAAYDAYLRAASAYWQGRSAGDFEKVIADYKEAVRLDSNFALPYAGWSIALSAYASFYAHGAAKRDWERRARLPALKAVALAPGLAEGHLALTFVHLASLDFERANEEFGRAVALAPGNARILRDYGLFAVAMGHTDAGIAAARRAAALDPLNVNSHLHLSEALRVARRYDEAMAAYQRALSLEPKPVGPALGDTAHIYYAVGNFETMRSVCEGSPESFMETFAQYCLALAYHKLGRHADAETALAREKALEGDAGAVDYGEIYAQWGNIPKALDWLETALRLHNPDLGRLKTEPLLDPLRSEPRFRAIERALKFPD
jgi:TolB-like protein/DNA-binding winged helix-turn-helix (wHTH) protein